MTKAKKTMGVQQILLSPKKEVKALLEYLCQQSGKLYNSGIYLARQTFFKTGKLLTGKFDLSFESSIVKSTVVNADLNGSANILRKVVSKLSVSLDRLNRRCLTTVARVRLWVLSKSALSAESQCL